MKLDSNRVGLFVSEYSDRESPFVRENILHSEEEDRRRIKKGLNLPSCARRTERLKSLLSNVAAAETEATIVFRLIPGNIQIMRGIKTGIAVSMYKFTLPLRHHHTPKAMF